MSRITIFQAKFSAAAGAGAQKGRSGDPVRRDAEAGGGAGREGGNAQRVRSGALDPGAQGAQEVLQGHDLRFPGCTADQRLPLGAAGGKQRVLRGPHAGKGQADAGAPELCRAAADLPVLLLDLRAQAPQRQQMQIDGPLSQPAAPGQAQTRPAAASQQRPHEDHRGTHPLHQRGRDLKAIDAGGVYVHPVALPPHPAAQMLQDLQRRVHVPQPGHPPELHRPRAEEAGRQDREARVFGALHAALPLQTRSAPDPPNVHENTPRAQNQAILCAEGELSEE